MLSPKLMIGCGIAAIFGLLILIFAIWGISLYNKEVRLRSTINAKQIDNTNEYDNMWKKISQVAQVTEGQKNALLEIFTGYANARSGKGNDSNLLMRWVQESVPNVDTSTFNQLMNVITSSRDAFTMRQKELLDLKREHDILLDTFPGSIVFSILSREKIKVNIVTSSRTEESFKTGKDDDVNVFQKK